MFPDIVSCYGQHEQTFSEKLETIINKYILSTHLYRFQANLPTHFNDSKFFNYD